MRPHPGGEGLRAATLVLVLVLALLTACTPKSDAPTATLPEGTPVILISIDTLRADHLPAYGYQGVETPHLDALRRDGVLFTNAYTPTPLTFPAHSSLLTGLLPAAHGVRDNVGYALDREKISRGELPFLPQILKGQGYATGGAVSAYVLQGKHGLRTGFDFYEDAVEFRANRGLGGLQRPGGETLKVSLDWLRGAAEKPFFYFFHIYEPHTPYTPPEPFASRYAASPYDGEIAAADAIVGELIAELKRLDAYDRALVILLSDHGEGLGDHGEEEHGVLLYREAIHVPLLLKLPDARLAGATAEAPVELTDVVPTVLSLLGLPKPESLRGSSLMAALDASAPPRRAYSETFYPRLHFGWSDLASLIDARWHYIEGPDPELYDIVADPRETRNLLRDERRAYADLRRAMEGYSRTLAPPSAVDEETRQAMIALGYVGSSGGTTEGPLPDPKSRIGALTDLKTGFRHSSQGEHAAAAAAFRKVLEVNPGMVDAWEFLARSLQKLGDSDGALAAYQEALRISGGSSHIAMSAASLFFDLGRLADAETHARMAEAAHPSFAHGLLARIALARKDFDAAEKEARQAMEEDEGSRIGPLITLAEVLHARGDNQGALDTVRQAAAAYEQREAKDPDLIRGLALIRGQALADLGDAAGAEAAFREEIRLFPDNLRAYSSLALVYALSGRPAEVGPTLRSLVEANPTPDAYAEAVKTLRLVGDPGSAAGLLRHALGQYPDSRALR
ncbi:MAG TPA: sulfatase-like hydrolase/transferase, partial [Thermoanaerobaculia bacterium]|nr:sulfatase-like hydrolase/transferase [Thermoanaerobaculia bacterium]